jgi:elongation factor P
MYTASDLRKGLRVQLDGQPYLITEFNFNKPGKGQAIYFCRMRNMLTGVSTTKTYRSNDVIDKPDLSERSMTYSYAESDHYVFLDSDYEQVLISGEVLGDARFFLIEDIKVDVLFFNNQPVAVTLPTFVEKRVVYTEPGARGNTATNVQKPAKLDGGFEVAVPLFVNEGDVVRIDTRTYEYADRVAKK